MPIDIVILSKDRVIDVAGLHIKYLRTPFKGNTGEQFLRLYYTALCQQNGGIGYVALSNGQTVGYVCGIWDPKLVRMILIKNHWKSLLLTFVQSLFTNPGIFRDLFRRLAEILRKQKSISLQGYELRPIVVAAESRGSEVGPLLVSTLLKDAKKRGFSSVFLLTEQNNIAANRFYQKQGFEPAGSLERSNQIYIYYSHIL